MNAKKRAEIFNRLERENFDPEIELNHQTTYELLVAVVLSAHSTDKGVNKATVKLFKIANTPEKMIKLGEKNLKKYIQSIGLYNTKAKNIIGTSQLLVKNFHSKVPQTREELETLPGVGRKSANVILNCVFGKPIIAVDTHVFRVSNRTQLAPGKNVREVEDQLMKVVPDKYKVKAHRWLVLFGRYICTAKKPRCAACPISDLCEYPDKMD